ncbi:hypothetical protein MKW94_004239 [Papaver nudicaule]|uniref:Uncharacterized protein n=1 Tax=Papaver nudicaule TaxID=74823 RepID=A0AA41RU79_PAPNU|nr:hypothetical protein [Papaver nudicaule]
MELILSREDVLDVLNIKRTQFESEEEHFMENEGKHVNDLQGGYKVVVLPVDGGHSFNPYTLRVNAEKLIRVLDAAVATNLSIAGDCRFITEAETMIGEIKQLIIALWVSCPRILSAPFFSMLKAPNTYTGSSQASASSKSSKKEKSRSEKGKKGQGKRK